MAHAILNLAAVNIFLLGTKYFLFQQTNILKIFEWLSLTRHFAALRGDFLNIDISQSNVATSLRRGVMF